MDLFEAAGIPADRHGRPRPPRPARPPDPVFDDSELAYFGQCPVGELATWYFDLREADSDRGRRSRMSRQLAAIIKRRGIADAELGPASEAYVRSALLRGAR